MNERIKELADEAAKFSAIMALTTGESGDKLFVEKFAELIVAECINKIETYHIPVGNSAAGEMACGMTYSALNEIRDELKKHFGVEE